MHGAPESPHGRGAASNPPNRFTPLWHVRDPDWTDPEDPAPTTQFFKDTARASLTSHANPDVGFTYKAGCEFSGVLTLLTLAIESAKSGNRVWGRQKNTRYAEAACRRECA